MITEQGYIPQLVRCLEEGGVRPVPIFINGIEAHTVVRALASAAHHLVLPASAQEPTAVCLAPQMRCMRGPCSSLVRA